MGGWWASDNRNIWSPKHQFPNGNFPTPGTPWDTAPWIWTAFNPLKNLQNNADGFEMLQDFFCLVCSLERKKKNNNNFSRLLMWTMKRSAVNALQEKLSEESVSLSTLERFIASPLSLWCMTGIFFKLHFWVCWLYSWAHFSHFNIPDGRVACWWEAPKKTRGK